MSGVYTKKWTFGMGNMEIKDFSAKDICTIIQKCRESGVVSLKLGKIEVQFDSLGVERSSIAGKHETPSKIEPVQELEVSVKDKRLMEQWHVAQDMIDDPVVYEQAVIDNMLLEETNGSNGPEQAKPAL